MDDLLFATRFGPQTLNIHVQERVPSRVTCEIFEQTRGLKISDDNVRG